jgi:hypothetical protein
MVIPAQAGIQPRGAALSQSLESRFRGNDGRRRLEHAVMLFSDSEY